MNRSQIGIPTSVAQTIKQLMLWNGEGASLLGSGGGEEN